MIVYGDEVLCEWASQHLFNEPNVWDEKARAIGVAKDDKLIAAVIYTDCHPHMLEMTIVSVDPLWCSRYTLKVFFSYPFRQLGLHRVQAVVAASNEGAISMLKRLGFTQEGYHPKAYFGGVDAMSFGMLKQDCNWL